jgi:hypothetical protein
MMSTWDQCVGAGFGAKIWLEITVAAPNGRNLGWQPIAMPDCMPCLWSLVSHRRHLPIYSRLARSLAPSYIAPHHYEPGTHQTHATLRRHRSPPTQLTAFAATPARRTPAVTGLHGILPHLHLVHTRFDVVS